MFFTRPAGTVVILLTMGLLSGTAVGVWAQDQGRPGAGSAATASEGKEGDKGDDMGRTKDPIEGVWQATELECIEGATPAAKDRLTKRCQWVIGEKMITVRIDGKVQAEASFVLRPSEKPAALDLTLSASPLKAYKGQTFPAIYKVEGDTLTVCSRLPGAKRPTEFARLAGISGDFQPVLNECGLFGLAVFRRVAPQAPAKDDGGAKAADPGDGDQLVTSVRQTVGEKGPTRVFKLYATPAFSNYHYRIDVCDADGTRVLQSEAIRNGVPLEGKKDAFQIVDVNDDGYLDIQILGGETQGKAWYKVWLYDTDKGTFVWRAKD